MHPAWVAAPFGLMLLLDPYKTAHSRSFHLTLRHELDLLPLRTEPLPSDAAHSIARSDLPRSHMGKPDDPTALPSSTNGTSQTIAELGLSLRLEHFESFHLSVVVSCMLVLS